jgi:hypothetical protein
MASHAAQGELSAVAMARIMPPNKTSNKNRLKVGNTLLVTEPDTLDKTSRPAALSLLVHAIR